VSTIDIASRRTPRFGALNATLIGIELRRVLRNRRAVIFTLVMPALLYILFGSNAQGDSQTSSGEIAAYVLVSMAVYGAALACTSGGAMVSTERALGWSRQLRLTPLSPLAYVLVKLLVALTLGGASVLAVNVVGVVTGKPDMSAGTWVACALISWLGSLVFAAFGLFMGYLLPSENVMQILGPMMALLAFVGGLFAPIKQGTLLDHFSQLTPMYGLGHLARWPLMGEGFHIVWLVNLRVWLAIFVAGTVWRFRRDTARG
jgi:ABC-2 type transport system permease protein